MHILVSLALFQIVGGSLYNNLKDPGSCDPLCLECQYTDLKADYECLKCFEDGKPPRFDAVISRSMCKQVFCKDKFCELCHESSQACLKCHQGTHLFKGTCFPKCPEAQITNPDGTISCVETHSKDLPQFKEEYQKKLATEKSHQPYYLIGKIFLALNFIFIIVRQCLRLHASKKQLQELQEQHLPPKQRDIEI